MHYQATHDSTVFLELKKKYKDVVYKRRIAITGATFIGTGASGMAQDFSGAEQGLIGTYTGSSTEGTPITVTNSKSQALMEYEPALDCEVLIFRCPEMISGESYTVTIGQQSSTMEAQ